MMKRYLIGWNFMRIIRLILGAVVVGQGVYAGDWLIAGLGALFAATAIFNVGCCASGACNTYTSTDNRNTDRVGEEVSYEEIKLNK